MLRQKMLDSHRTRAAWHLIQRSISLAQRNGIFRRNVWQKFAEAPDAALVKRCERSEAVEPERFQSRWICGCTRNPVREKELQQVAASSTTKVPPGRVRHIAAINAAQAGHGFGSLSSQHEAVFR